MSTRQDGIAIRKANPCASEQAVANKIGISRQRVHQHLVKAGLPTHHYIYKKKCLECGKILSNVNKSGYCLNCKIKLNKIPSTKNQIPNNI